MAGKLDEESSREKAMKMTQRPLMLHEKLSRLLPPSYVYSAFTNSAATSSSIVARIILAAKTSRPLVSHKAKEKRDVDALSSRTSPLLCNLRISFDRSNANKFTWSIRTKSFIFPRKIIRLNGNGRENWRCPDSQTEANAERNSFVWRNF